MIFYLFREAGYEAKHEGENPRGGDYTLLSGNHDYDDIDNDNDDDDFCQTFEEEIMKMRRIWRRGWQENLDIVQWRKRMINPKKC